MIKLFVVLEVRIETRISDDAASTTLVLCARKAVVYYASIMESWLSIARTNHLVEIRYTSEALNTSLLQKMMSTCANFNLEALKLRLGGGVRIK